MSGSEKERLSQYIAQEMREASRGSFPLSPGIMDGHYATANLYWHFRRNILARKTIPDIFGKLEPDPPVLLLPDGHRDVATDGLNKSVWKTFLQVSFTDRPHINPQTEIHTLLSTNAYYDSVNFDRRLKGEKSHVVPRVTPVPSLLRAFLYEDMFQERNEFFRWLFAEMRAEVSRVAHHGFAEDWSTSLGSLVGTWNSHFKDTRFIPRR